MLCNLPRLSPITQDWSPDKPQLIDNACEGVRLRGGEKEKKKEDSCGERYREEMSEWNELHKQNWEHKMHKASCKWEGSEEKESGMRAGEEKAIKPYWRDAGFLLKRDGDGKRGLRAGRQVDQHFTSDTSRRVKTKKALSDDFGKGTIWLLDPLCTWYSHTNTNAHTRLYTLRLYCANTHLQDTGCWCSAGVCLHTSPRND